MWKSSHIALIPWVLSVDVAAVFMHYEYVGWSAAQSISRELSIAHIVVIIVAVNYLQSVTYYTLVRKTKTTVVYVTPKTKTGGKSGISGKSV